jgi:hypothetical protein
VLSKAVKRIIELNQGGRDPARNIFATTTHYSGVTRTTWCWRYRSCRQPTRGVDGKHRHWNDVGARCRLVSNGAREIFQGLRHSNQAVSPARHRPSWNHETPAVYHYLEGDMWAGIAAARRRAARPRTDRQVRPQYLSDRAQLFADYGEQVSFCALEAAEGRYVLARSKTAAQSTP